MKIIAWLKNFYGELTLSEVHFQSNISDFPVLKDISPFFVKVMDINDINEVQQWVNLINDAYTEVRYDVEMARKRLVNHHYLKQVNTYLVYDNDMVVAAFSTGPYIINPKVGGGFRLAVKKSHQSHGLGRYIFLYAYMQLKDQGIEMVESVISIYRLNSLLIHYKCGFTAQTDPKKIVHKTSNFNRNPIQRIRALRALRNAYKVFTDTKK